MKSEIVSRFGRLLGGAVALSALVCAAESRVYPVPDEIARHAAGYTVAVDGVDAPVTPVRCSAMPVDCVWPGHEREKDQTEICGMVRFAFGGAVRVRVDAGRDFAKAVIRPLSRKVAFARTGNAIEFTLTRPGGYSVEFDGRHRNLHVIADAAASPKVDRGDSRVRYFGPGLHEAGLITLKSGETLFVDEGAWVRGHVAATDAKNVRVAGRGVIDMSGVEAVVTPIDEEKRRQLVASVQIVENAKRAELMSFRFCDDVTVEGVTLVDSMTWNIILFGCRRVVLDDVKTLGNWRYNADGFDIMNSRDVTMKNCFVRTFDDSYVVKGFSSPYVRDNGGFVHNGVVHDCVADVLVSNCVTWCDWGRNLEVGLETCAKEMRNIRFCDCDCIYATHVALDVQNGDCALVRDVTFENIRVEYDDFTPASCYAEHASAWNAAWQGAPAPLAVCEMVFSANWSIPGERGRTRNVVYRNIDVYGPRVPACRLAGHDADHRVDGVVFENIRLNGKDVTDEFARAAQRNAFVSSKP